VPPSLLKTALILAEIFTFPQQPGFQHFLIALFHRERYPKWLQNRRRAMKLALIAAIVAVSFATPAGAATRFDLGGYGSLTFGNFASGGSELRLGTTVNVARNDALPVSLSRIADFSFRGSAFVRLTPFDPLTLASINFGVSDIVSVGGNLIADYPEPGTRFRPDGFFLTTGFQDWVGFNIPRVRLEIRDYSYAYFDESGRLFGSGGFFAVPEPASWMMMIIGFGIVGASLRRRAGGMGYIKVKRRA
jgi:PEP-CTERM motif